MLFLNLYLLENESRYGQDFTYSTGTVLIPGIFFTNSSASKKAAISFSFILIACLALASSIKVAFLIAAILSVRQTPWYIAFSATSRASMIDVLSWCSSLSLSE